MGSNGQSSRSPASGGAAGRQRRSARTGRRGTTTRVVIASVAALVVVAAGAAVPVLAARHAAKPTAKPNPPVHRPASHATAAPAAAAAGPVCPLTGVPAPGGLVPQRPALAVKIDNYPTARPQSALDQADVVFEEPVEGGITRLVGVFQCQAPPLIGPVRSAREPDVAIADQLSHPLFVHAGGINPILAMIRSANLFNIDLVTSYSGLDIHPAGRYAPYDTYVSASSMLHLDPTDAKPPAPLFTYSATPPVGGQAVSSVAIPFSSYSDNTWTWMAGSGAWQLSVGGRQATTLSGDTIDGATAPVTAANVVVLHVRTFKGPWIENSEGNHEVEVVATGSGPATILRNGEALTGTWERSSLSAPPTLLDQQGQPVPLAPGETWVELVPDGITVTPTATAAAPGSGATGTVAGGGAASTAAAGQG